MRPEQVYKLLTPKAYLEFLLGWKAAVCRPEYVDKLLYHYLWNKAKGDL